LEAVAPDVNMLCIDVKEARRLILEVKLGWMRMSAQKTIFLLSDLKMLSK